MMPFHHLRHRRDRRLAVGLALLLLVLSVIFAAFCRGNGVKEVTVRMDDGSSVVLPATRPTTIPAVVVSPVHFVKGLNLGKHDEASGAHPFQDLFHEFVGGGADRKSLGWGKVNKPWEPNPSLILTDRGYPLSEDASAYSYLSDLGEGEYEFTYGGSCSVSFSGRLQEVFPTSQPATLSTTQPVGTTRRPRIVRLDPLASTTGIVTVRDIDKYDPPRDFHLTPRGEDANRVYSYRYLARIREAGAESLRPMDWRVTNRQRVHQWKDRRRGDDFRQVGEYGVSDDLLVALPRELPGVSLYLNAPDFYDDLSFEQMAEWYRSALPTGSRLRVEYSNELWNPDFDQRRRIDALARARGVQMHEAYASECVRFAKAWQRGWARSSNDIALDLILPAQTASPSLTNEVFKSIRKLDAGGAKWVGFTHLAVSGYFSYPPELDLELEALERAGKPDAAVDLYFQRLMADTAVPQDRRLKQKVYAEREDLGLIVYEGGLGMVEYNPLLRRTAASATKRVARNDPRMGDFVKAVFNACERDYSPAPGSVFNWFDFVNRDQWGLIESRFQLTSPRWESFKGYPQ